MVTGCSQMARSPQQMMDRVQKRVLDKFLDSATTPQTKRFAAKVHTQLARNDGAFTTLSMAFRTSSPLRRFPMPALPFSAQWIRYR